MGLGINENIHFPARRRGVGRGCRRRGSPFFSRPQRRRSPTAQPPLTVRRGDKALPPSASYLSLRYRSPKCPTVTGLEPLSLKRCYGMNIVLCEAQLLLSSAASSAIRRRWQRERRRDGLESHRRSDGIYYGFLDFPSSSKKASSMHCIGKEREET